MTTKLHDGGQAFPTTVHPCSNEGREMTGMSLRAHFAAKALPHSLSQARADMDRYGNRNDDYVPLGVAEACRIADALIAELDKSKSIQKAVTDPGEAGRAMARHVGGGR